MKILKRRHRKPIIHLYHSCLDKLDAAAGIRDRKIPPRRMNYNIADGAKNGLLRYSRLFWSDAAESELPFIMEHGKLGLDGMLLDYGCGLGRLAFAIAESGSRVRYRGVDIVEDRIAFLNDRYRDIDNISFEYLPITSDHYAREEIRSGLAENGVTQSAARIDLDDASVDCQFSMSVFTHMTEDEIVDALREIRRVVKPGGVLINSWLAVDDETRASLARGGADRQLPFEKDGMLFSHADNIRMATAYTNEAISRIYHQAGFGEFTLYKGWWDGTGRTGSPVYQDIAVTEVT